MTTVGQRIRELRKAKNLTQRELADRIGLNFTYLSRIENDRLDADQTPREETLRLIAGALDADLDDLLLLAHRVPQSYQDRILEQPAMFKKVLDLSDDQLRQLLDQMEDSKT